MILLGSLGGLGGRLVLPLGGQSLGRLGVHVLGSAISLVASGAAATSFFLFEATLVRESALNATVLPGGANAFQASWLLLTAVLTIVSQLDAGLTHEGLAQARVDVPRGSTPQCVCGRGLSGLLAMATEHIGVVGLAANLGSSVGGV